jgi:tripartite-type tricarboxylate transporter receptor subunit TctC
MRLLLRLAIALLALTAPLGAAQEQAYPTRPIRLIVPFPPGGPIDAIARPLGAKLAAALGQAVIVENRSGAGGVIGTAAVAQAQADGYTIGIAPAGPLAIAPSVSSTPYQPSRDLVPITQVVRVPEAIIAIPGLGVHSLAELVARARKDPGGIAIASTGPLSLPHIASELLQREAGIELLHVPYGGAAPAVNDLLGGHVQLMFADLLILLPHIQSGKLVPLALASETRAAALPDLPTTAELGYPELLANNWYVLIAPAGTSPAIVDALHDAAVAALRSPDLEAELTRRGAIAVGSSPRECAEFLRAEAMKWAALAKTISDRGQD